jgi:hypothetical protein
MLNIEIKRLLRHTECITYYQHIKPSHKKGGQSIA